MIWTTAAADEEEGVNQLIIILRVWPINRTFESKVLDCIYRVAVAQQWRGGKLTASIVHTKCVCVLFVLLSLVKQTNVCRAKIKEFVP